MVVLGSLVFALVWWVMRSPGRRIPPSHGAVPAARAVGLRRLSLVDWVERPLLRGGLCAGAGGVTGAAVLGLVGFPVGALGGALLSWWVGRLEPPSVAKANEATRRAMPLAVDLLAACAEAGQPLGRSVTVVASAVGGVLGARLNGLAARIALGADPVTEWERLRVDPQLAPLARTVARSLESGAPLADGLARLADDRRRVRRTEMQLRARSVGVKAAAPLGACFLPAFMLIGVVPTVAGSFARLLG